MGEGEYEVMNPNFIRTLSKSTNRGWLGLLSIFLGLLAWHFVALYSEIPPFILPSPVGVWGRFMRAFNDGSLLYHTRITRVDDAGYLRQLV